MQESELKAFIDEVVNYFSNLSDEPAVMGVPFVKPDEAIIQDFTGLIGVSGARKGGIYLTASRKMAVKAADLLLKPEIEKTDEILIDLVGEITNIIAGNVRKVFGSQFMISVPIVLKGDISELSFKLRKPVYIIPINWKETKSFLAVGLD